MLRKEASVIGELLKKFSSPQDVILNVGSGSALFRQSDQPYIHDKIFRNLSARVMHSDIFDHAGVDIQADVMSDEGVARLKNIKADVVLASNLLEHVESPILGLLNLTRIADKGSVLIITGPSQYPYHPDPIDNGFRPGRDFVSHLLPEFETLIDRTYLAGPICSATRQKASLVRSLIMGALAVAKREQHPQQKAFFLTKFYVYVGVRRL